MFLMHSISLCYYSWISFSAPHHFNSENFVQGRTLIMEGMAAIKANIGKENFKAARETLGRILHTLQVRGGQLDIMIVCFLYF